MGGGGMKTIQDPLAGYKQWAANTTQQNYGQNIQPNLPGLSDYFGKNFGQSANQTFQNTDPLFQDVYKALQGDVEGTGGPFTSLKQNLLGAFDTGAQKFTMDPLKEQLIKEGIYSSGQGMGTLANAGNDLATQRSAISSQTDVNELGMAQALSQALMGYNQQQGFANPLTALQNAYQMGQPQSVQDINNMYYQQPNATADILGKVLPMVASAAIPGVGGMVAGGLSALGGAGGSASDNAWLKFMKSGNQLPGYNPV